MLKADAAITHVFAVHCETTSGILNPIGEIGALAQKYGKSFLIDSMSAFGALPLDAQAIKPRRDRGVLEQVHRGRAGPRLRDLPQGGAREDRRATPRRWCSTCTTSGANFEKTGQYRFTPPIHVIVVVPSGADGVLRRRRAAGARQALCGELPRADRRHARARLRAAAGRQPAGADHRHLPHAGRPALRVPAFYDAAEGARLRDLSRQAHGRGLVPHRLHRAALSRAHARRAGGDPRYSRRDGRRRSLQAARSAA